MPWGKTEGADPQQVHEQLFDEHRSLEPNMIINFLQQRILCWILHAYEKWRIIAGKYRDVIVLVPIVA